MLVIPRSSIAVIAMSVAGQALFVEQALAQPTAPASTADTSSSSRPDRHARNYILRAGSMELLAIRSAELAARRSVNSRIRSAALAAIRDHTGLSKQLSFAGRRLNILPSAALLPEHQQALLYLINSADFDATYVRQRRIESKNAYRLHREYLRTGTSPTLRPVAQRAAAALYSELERLGRL